MWNVKNYKYYNEILENNIKYTFEYKFKDEDIFNIDEKIKFLDYVSENKFSYLFNLINKYEIYYKNKNHKITKEELKEWIEWNDSEYIFKNDKNILCDEIGDYSFLNYYSNIQNGFILVNNNKLYGKRYNEDTEREDFINEMFHRTLVYCSAKERDYYYCEDEYGIKVKEIKKYIDKYSRYKFGFNFRKSKNIIKLNGEKATLEQCNKIINYYKELDEFVKSLNIDL